MNYISFRYLGMSVRLQRLAALATALVLVAYGVSGAAQEENQMEVEYYSTFGGYQLPLKLQERLSKEQAEAKKAYYIARRDASGRLVDVRKILNGELFFRHEYAYDQAGVLIEVRSTNRSGRIVRRRLDAEGKFVPVADE